MAEAVPITAESLAGINALADLEIDDRKALATQCKGYRYGADERIFFREDPADSVVFVISGRVGVTLVSPSGRETILRDLSQGDMFGEISAIDGLPRSADVVAKSESVVATVTAPAFRTMLRDYPEFVDFTLKHLVRLVRSLSDRVFEYDTFKVAVRVRHELYRQSMELGYIDPAPKAGEIASRVGTHREAVSREISRLTKAGIIERLEGRLLIHQREALIADNESLGAASTTDAP